MWSVDALGSCLPSTNNVCILLSLINFQNKVIDSPLSTGLSWMEKKKYMCAGLFDCLLALNQRGEEEK